MRKSDYHYLLGLLKDNAGWDFDDDEYFIIDKKMYNFVREKGYASVEELIAELKMGQKALLWQVVEALALSETSFYRDYKVFKNFEDTILPHIRELNRGAKKLRIWSLGCSSGQETYSIAIAVRNKLLNVGDWDIKIIGTDLSTVSVTKAQRGLYNQFEIQMGLNARMIIDNFHQEQGGWMINDDIAEMVEFRRYNLMDDLTFMDKFDIIFCRNVLHFFNRDMQRHLLEKIYTRQAEGGFLYLGYNENISGLDDFYEPVPGLTCLYQARIMPVQLDKPVIEDEGDGVTDDNMPSFVRPVNLSYRRPVLSETLKK